MLSQRDEASKSYTQAITAFDEALRRDPDYVAAHNNKRTTLINLGGLEARFLQQDEAMQRYIQAVAAFDEALRIATDDVSPERGLSSRTFRELSARS